MGIIGDAIDWVGGLFSGSSDSGSRDNSSTMYEPDKVRVAEIERERDVRLALMEQEKITLYKETQLELLEFNARMEAAVVEAKVKGFNILQKSLIEMSRELNIVAEQRFKLIETSSLETIKQIDQHYEMLRKEINKEDDLYLNVKLPKLIKNMEQYQQDSPSFKIYHKAVENDSASHVEYKTQQFKDISQRQSQLFASSLKSKEQLNSHIDELVGERVKQLEINVEKQQSSTSQLKALPQQTQPQLSQQSKDIIS